MSLLQAIFVDPFVMIWELPLFFVEVLIGGLIVVETVFGYPGLGQLMIFAVTNRDVPLVQAVALLVATIYALANLGADILYAALNPRIRY